MNKAIIFDWIGTLYDRDKGPIEGAERVLREAHQRGYKIALISLTKKSEKRKNEIGCSGLGKFFDVSAVVVEKTPEIYESTMRLLDSTPATTMIVDDRTVRGIKVGNQLGCRTYWVQRGEYASEAPTHETGEPTQILRNIEELLMYM